MIFRFYRLPVCTSSMHNQWLSPVMTPFVKHSLKNVQSLWKGESGGHCICKSITLNLIQTSKSYYLCVCLHFPRKVPGIHQAVYSSGPRWNSSDLRGCREGLVLALEGAHLHMHNCRTADYDFIRRYIGPIYLASPVDCG